MAAEDPRDERTTDALLARCLKGEVSPEVAAMQLILATGGTAGARAAVASARRRLPPGVSPARLAAVALLLSEDHDGCARIAALMQDPAAPATGTPARLARVRRFFDRAVALSEEASVALYSLGSPAVLARATAEVVTALRRFGVLGPDRAALEIGCGTGRIALALAPAVAEVYGLDLSRRMIAAARRHAGDRLNLHFSVTRGRDLGRFPDRRFDLVYAVDSFPYLVETGIVETHVHEAARVLAPGGDLVVFNYSYRGDPAADRADVGRLAAAAGFAVIASGARPFTLWDALAFHLRRRA
ncbi:MAG TPA: class I SAM-dependent methyltransferase [Polyangia bacterium]